MNERPKVKQPQTGSISPYDIYFVLFRRKWLILTFSTLAIVAAAIVYLKMPTTYVSTASIAVPYIYENKMLPSSATKDPDGVKSAESNGEGMIGSEMEILRSLDIAEDVAAFVTAQRILSKTGGGTNLAAAAGTVAEGLELFHPKGTDIINLRFRHPDPSVVQDVLRRIIVGYQTKHAEFHSPTANIDMFLTGEIGKMREKLGLTQSNLVTMRTNLGVISVEGARKELVEQVGSIKGEIDLAQRKLVINLKLLQEIKPVVETNAGAADPIPPEDKVKEYLKLCQKQSELHAKEITYDKLGYSQGHAAVQRLHEALEEVEAKKAALVSSFPKLASLHIPSGADSDPMNDVAATEARIRSLTIQTNALQELVSKLETDITDLDARSVDFGQMEFQAKIEQENYQDYQKALDKVRLQGAVGPDRMGNIKIVQQPSRPMLDYAKKPKAVMMILAGGILGSLVLAFLLELYLDPRIKRPSDVETKVRLPLFLVIPNVQKNGHAERVHPGGEALALPEASGETAGEQSHVAQYTSNGLKPYYDALRDRLMFYFHSKNMTHKPKLVGVTSCSHASGATTLAAGLAASLSETGEGNVLLVDMNLPGGAAHPFYRGKPGCGIQEALENEKRDDARVQENLYLASAGQMSGRNGGLMPRRFSDLMPKLKASDYDFIIFDMPPVSQTSATSNLAGMLDMTFLVLEAEKTNRDAANRAATLFEESQAPVMAVLNKSRTYLPSWLHQEI